MNCKICGQAVTGSIIQGSHPKCYWPLNPPTIAYTLNHALGSVSAANAVINAGASADFIAKVIDEYNKTNMKQWLATVELNS